MHASEKTVGLMIGNKFVRGRYVRGWVVRCTCGMGTQNHRSPSARWTDDNRTGYNATDIHGRDIGTAGRHMLGGWTTGVRSTELQTSDRAREARMRCDVAQAAPFELGRIGRGLSVLGNHGRGADWAWDTQ